MRAFKVVVAGDGGVGKTTLIDAYKLGRFFEHKTTIGLNITVCVVDLGRGVRCKFVIYDLSGQPRFMRIAREIPRIVRGADGAILAFDLSSFTSLLVLKEWAEIIRKVNEDIPVILVGTKADLEPEVNDEEIERLREELGAIKYIRTSSKLMLNVEEPFKLLARAIIARGRRPH